MPVLLYALLLIIFFITNKICQNAKYSIIIIIIDFKLDEKTQMFYFYFLPCSLARRKEGKKGFKCQKAWPRLLPHHFRGSWKAKYLLIPVNPFSVYVCVCKWGQRLTKQTVHKNKITGKIKPVKFFVSYAHNNK